jgi:hypothetical protein
MTEERKFAILIAATILSARKLAELKDPDKPTPKKIGARDDGNSRIKIKNRNYSQAEGRHGLLTSVTHGRK